MRVLKRWIRNWLNNYEDAIGPVSVCHDQDIHTNTKKITFTLNRAIGGAVIQSRIYDRTLDEDKTTLYIINDEQEFTEAFAQIVSLEYLKI
jgi:hypothetical protein